VLHAVVEPEFIDFQIKSTDDGDMVNGLNFEIKPNPSVTKVALAKQ
jgi:hypothetical protein